jgi:hypothetical protein
MRAPETEVGRGRGGADPRTKPERKGVIAGEFPGTANPRLAYSITGAAETPNTTLRQNIADQDI